MPAGILAAEPGLKPGACDGLRSRDGLNRVPGGAIPDEDRGVILRPEQFPDILRCGERARRECAGGAHGGSCLAKNTGPQSNKSGAGAYLLIRRTSETYLCPGRRSTRITTLSESAMLVLIAR